jgi:hypothetical protein
MYTYIGYTEMDEDTIPIRSNYREESPRTPETGGPYTPKTSTKKEGRDREIARRRKQSFALRSTPKSDKNGEIVGSAIDIVGSGVDSVFVGEALNVIEDYVSSKFDGVDKEGDGNKTETTTPSLDSKESDVPPKPSTPSLLEASKAKGFSFF